MKGWQPVEELTRWAFAQAPVVMANEAHNGMTRCVRTREVGARMVRAAHEMGVRRLAMEALPAPAAGAPVPILDLPQAERGYLAQPDIRALITTALDLGWTLWAYEAAIDVIARPDPAQLLSIEFTNWREREQAVNLCKLLDAAPGEPLLVWSGNSHASKVAPDDGWIPMGHHVVAMSGLEPFVIDQAVSVAWPDHPPTWLPEVLTAAGEAIQALGGTAGILRGQAPPPLDTWPGVDAVVVSTDNELS
jgi:hypothetical protein